MIKINVVAMVDAYKKEDKESPFHAYKGKIGDLIKTVKIFVDVPFFRRGTKKGEVIRVARHITIKLDVAEIGFVPDEDFEKNLAAVVCHHLAEELKASMDPKSKKKKKEDEPPADPPGNEE